MFFLSIKLQVKRVTCRHTKGIVTTLYMVGVMPVYVEKAQRTPFLHIQIHTVDAKKKVPEEDQEGKMHNTKQ